jgi:hypothetical protein
MWDTAKYLPWRYLDNKFKGQKKGGTYGSPPGTLSGGGLLLIDISYKVCYDFFELIFLAKENVMAKTIIKERPDWDHYFMKMAELAATRSTCLRRQVGAAIVMDKHVISTGYNGAPKGVPHCEEREHA